MKNLGSGESKLETVISYVLIIGVLLSLILTIVGLVFYRSYGHLNILLDDPTMFLQAQNFFSFLGGLASGPERHGGTIFFITLGIIVLILTPYLRVIASVIYFGAKRDIKFVLITLFVLTALTISLTLH